MEPQPNEQVVQQVARSRLIWQTGSGRFLFEHRYQPDVLSFVEIALAGIEQGLFPSSHFSVDELGDVGETKLSVEGDEIGLHYPSAHQVDASQ